MARPCRSAVSGGYCEPGIVSSTAAGRAVPNGRARDPRRGTRSPGMVNLVLVAPPLVVAITAPAALPVVAPTPSTWRSTGTKLPQGPQPARRSLRLPGGTAVGGGDHGSSVGEAVTCGPKGRGLDAIDAAQVSDAGWDVLAPPYLAAVGGCEDRRAIGDDAHGNTGPDGGARKLAHSLSTPGEDCLGPGGACVFRGEHRRASNRLGGHITRGGDRTRDGIDAGDGGGQGQPVSLPPSPGRRPGRTPMPGKSSSRGRTCRTTPKPRRRAAWRVPRRCFRRHCPAVGSRRARYVEKVDDPAGEGPLLPGVTGVGCGQGPPVFMVVCPRATQLVLVAQKMPAGDPIRAGRTWRVHWALPVASAVVTTTPPALLAKPPTAQQACIKRVSSAGHRPDGRIP